MNRHAAIIGAGPAGSLCAWPLAKAGWRVTLFERATFPRVKVCGEFVSPAATDVLEEILPEAELLAAGARRIRRVELLAAGRTRQWQMPAAAWALSRASLDTLLLARAAEAGATVLSPASVRDVEYGDAGVTVRMADGDSIAADVVIHADGAGRFDPAGAVEPAPGLVGMKCHLRLPPKGDVLSMRAARGAYVGTVSVEGGLSTCALVARKSLVHAADGDGDQLLAALWPEYRPTWREGDWKASGVPRSGYRDPGHPRSFRIGNAAAAVDPVGGEGIGLALWSGRTLGALLANAAPEAAPLASVQHAIAMRYRRRLRVRRLGCRVIAEIMMRPTLAALLWPVAASPEVSLRAWYGATGKGLTPPAKRV
ncbi:MAG: NAD(P)/FAD-dependent oxidoreductase [Phycisphaerales bacterium]